MPAPDEYIGKTVAKKYRVEQMIGEGGMGKVYKATQIALEKPVVLKVLRQALLSDERTVARFQREAKVASRLNHPNSISIIDFGQSDDGAMYIAMEFVPGKDLHHILSREWPLPESRVIKIISQVLSALSDAHNAGVIHRDLKPENIMIEQRRGDPDFVKVLDFGIAKIMDSTGEDGPALTRAGFVCGTPEYMSPEQARGAQLDHRSDLYAMGVILYQLCSGLLPFDSDSAVGFATKHLTEQPPLPTKRRPDARISPGMERLIMKALAKNVDERPQTAEQFRAELLAVDKERRAGIGPSSRRGVASGQSNRRMTPVDQQETRVTTNPGPNPWGVDHTMKTEATVIRPDRTSPGTNTQNSGLTERRPGLDVTDPSALPRQPERATLAFKIATVVLVLLAIGVGGAFVYQSWKGHRAGTEDPWVPPPNAPRQTAVLDLERLWEREVALADRDVAQAARSASDGDMAWRRGDADLAIARYKDSFARDPMPQTALKLGELYFQKDDLAEAANWWRRFKKDAPGSKAMGYVNEVMPEI